MDFTGLDSDAARDFVARWLPAWSGNRPELLVSFYTEDAQYSDPAIPAGVRGREALLAYFRRLLSRNPEWVWTQLRSIPLLDGFLNFWHASIPLGTGRVAPGPGAVGSAGRGVVEVDGVCSVQLRDGRIYANHVFFDRSELLAAMATKVA